MNSGFGWQSMGYGGDISASDYKCVALSLVFLKCILDAFFYQYQKVMNRFAITFSPESLVVDFYEIINLLFTQYRNNSKQIEALSVLRDTLLSKLISWENEV